MIKILAAVLMTTATVTAYAEKNRKAKKTPPPQQQVTDTAQTNKDFGGWEQDDRVGRKWNLQPKHNATDNEGKK